MLVNNVGIDAESLSELLHIFKTFSGICCIFPRSTSGSATSVPDMHKLVHSLEVLLKYISIQHFLLGLGGIDWVFLCSLKELLVTNGFLASVLQLSDPSHTDSFALHCFGSPQYLIRHRSLESFSQNMFFCRSIIANELMCWIDQHNIVDNFRAQKWYSRL